MLPACSNAVEAIAGALLAMIAIVRSEEHTSELQPRLHLVCRLMLEKTENEGRGGPSRPGVVAAHLHADGAVSVPPRGRSRVPSRRGRGVARRWRWRLFFFFCPYAV